MSAPLSKERIVVHMNTLADYVEIIENNMECVILKVKPDSRMALIALGCFNGNEEMIRLTKGETQTCTLFYKDGGISSWSWGSRGHTLVSDSTSKCGEMVQHCLEEDFDICMAGSRKDIEMTLHIRKIGDSTGMVMVYKLMWFREDNICIHKNGRYLMHMDSLEKAKDYVYNRIEFVDEEQSVAGTGCQVLEITGFRIQKG